MFLLDAYLPKAPERRDFDFDRTGLKIAAPDNGIAPDTGAVAVSGNPIGSEPEDPPNETKVSAQTAAREAFGKLESAAPKKPPRKRTAHLQSAKAAQSPAAAQNPWSSPWSSDWSSNWTWRGAIADAPRQSGRRQAAKQPGGNPAVNQWSRNWNFNFAGAGRNSSCWGC